MSIKRCIDIEDCNVYTKKAIWFLGDGIKEINHYLEFDRILNYLHKKGYQSISGDNKCIISDDFKKIIFVYETLLAITIIPETKKIMFSTVDVFEENGFEIIESHKIKT